ncbi:16742_t:CDS:1, partial [Funneliformis caledonium]
AAESNYKAVATTVTAATIYKAVATTIAAVTIYEATTAAESRYARAGLRHSRVARSECRSLI